MTLQNLYDNIKKQRELTKELKYFNEYSENKLSDIPEIRIIEEDLFNRTIESLLTQIRLINSSIPELLKNLSITQKLPQSKVLETKAEPKSELNEIKKEKTDSLINDQEG